jgi:ribonucleoside-diphosphate reductase alpha chain
LLEFKERLTRRTKWSGARGPKGVMRVSTELDQLSAALRSGVDPRVTIDQLHGIRCMSAAVAQKSNKGVDLLSCPDAIARALEETVGSEEVACKSPFRRICEECDHPMRWEANCVVCDFCGHSNCG